MTKDATTIEKLTKAAQCAELLSGDVLDAHGHACHTDPLLAYALRDALNDAARLRDKLGEILLCQKE